MSPTIYTIGHSTRPIGAFVAALKAHGIACLVDVRTIPRSRHNPQYEQHALEAALAKAGITYQWAKDLGGLRKARKDLPAQAGSLNNLGWRNASFRGYADYMQTPAFAAALAQLEELARGQRVAIMCAEAVPWRCHRSLIADALVVRDWQVCNIMSEDAAKPHHLNPMAKVQNGILHYPLTTHQEKLL